MKGNLIPDDVVAGVTPPSNPIKPWDLKDEDGDVHSPSWYLDAWIVAREEYYAQLGKDTNPMSLEEVAEHMVDLDTLLDEYEKYALYVDQLFGAVSVETKKED